jgi:predicted unusual protein kinase regulating ubiquinone biosynthesis (AarF/ABC1/UbiB family)
MLRSTSICTSFIYNYLVSISEKDDKNTQILDKKCQKLKCLSDTLESRGGVLSKVSQVLSLNDHNNSVFSDCKPFSKKKTISYFKKFIENTDIQQITDVDFNVYKSGSVGQIHKSKYKGRDIIFKVQYHGLLEQTQTDLNLIDKITSYLYSFTDMKNATVDIKNKMYEELDYKLEAKNQQMMAEFYVNNDSIEIPVIIPELCTDKILGMYFVKGKSLCDFIKDSTQDEKNKLGMCMVNFIFENIYKRGIFYSDVHYGNFLIKSDSTLCVLDFGCLHKMNDELLHNMRKLHLSVRNKDKELFYSIIETLGIIKNDISPKSKSYIFDYFQIQYQPWTSEEFEFTDEWFEVAVAKDTELMKEWTLPPGMVYLNKIPYGAYHIFTKLKLKGRFLEVFDKMFESI